MQDEETIARILGRDSSSIVGQQLDTGLNRLSRQLANIERARNNIADMDEILHEIEQFQDETDNMVNNMANIEALLQNAEDEQEEAKKGLSQEEIKKLKLFTYKSVKKKGEEDVCSICLVGVVKGDHVF